MSSLTFDIRMLRSLLVVAETGSVTEAARRLGRSQPAITLQLKRLEDLTGRELFRHESRRMALTNDGEMMLSYASAILRMHDELVAQLMSEEIEGHVVLGTPDLYAPYVLPGVLSHFQTEFPKVQVKLQCSLSTPLVKLVHSGEVDVALVTRMNDFVGGQVVRREPLVWITGENSRAHEETPVPLALLPPGNIFRDNAINTLDDASQLWRIACVSESVAGLQAAVFSGMAVTVLGRHALVSGMRELPVSDHFPQLPHIEMLLYKSQAATSPAARALHDYLAFYLRSAGPELRQNLALAAQGGAE